MGWPHLPRQALSSAASAIRLAPPGPVSPGSLATVRRDRVGNGCLDGDGQRSRDGVFTHGCHEIAQVGWVRAAGAQKKQLAGPWCVTEHSDSFNRVKKACKMSCGEGRSCVA